MEKNVIVIKESTFPAASPPSGATKFCSSLNGLSQATSFCLRNYVTQHNTHYFLFFFFFSYFNIYFYAYIYFEISISSVKVNPNWTEWIEWIEKNSVSKQNQNQFKSQDFIISFFQQIKNDQ